MTVQYAGASFNARLGYSGRVAARPARRRVRDVDRADGAALAVSRAAVERAGLLDETLFLYVEDVEWSLRIRRAGFAVVFVPEARRAPQGLGVDRRPRVDDEPLLRHAQHDRRRRAPRAAAARRARRCGARSSSARISRRRCVASARARGGARGRSPAGATRAPAGLGQRSSRVDGLVRARRGVPREPRARARGRARDHSSGAASTSSTASAIAAGRAGRTAAPRRRPISGSDAGVRAGDRAAARHRLERRLPEALVERREDERRRASVAGRRARPSGRARAPRRRPAARRSRRRPSARAAAPAARGARARTPRTAARGSCAATRRAG